jgi:threonine synthase
LRFRSTGGRAPETDLGAALLQGLAPDGGLYVPVSLPPLTGPAIEALRGASCETTAHALGLHLLGEDLPSDDLHGIVRAALDFPIPLVPVEPGIYALELFHGPTLAFKDVGARFMARLMAHYRGGSTRPLVVLVATSGDTGAAVADAFHGLHGIRVYVLYPQGQVSHRQELMFTTLGGNVQPLAIQGTFDDCQKLVKAALADRSLRRRFDVTSANSINVGRLLPQILYYFHAWAQLPHASPPPVISVPSGNFGNLTAGLMAKRLGLPARRFVAATNANDVVPEYLASGRFRPRPSIRTISNAMDVGSPSNIARIQALYDHDLDHLRKDLAASAHSDAATRAAITRVHRQAGYLLDPHSAVGYLGLKGDLESGEYGVGRGSPGVFLATAHPAKFSGAIEPLIGHPIPVPPRMAVRLRGEARSVPMEPELQRLMEVLTGGDA